MRSRANRKIAGVCAGFAEYFDLDVTVVRVVWLIVALFGGGGILAYIIAWIVMPEEPEYVPATPPATNVAALSGVIAIFRNRLEGGGNSPFCFCCQLCRPIIARMLSSSMQ